jgi:hypothetical protein
MRFDRRSNYECRNVKEPLSDSGTTKSAGTAAEIGRLSVNPDLLKKMFEIAKTEQAVECPRELDPGAVPNKNLCRAVQIALIHSAIR